MLTPRLGHVLVQRGWDPRSARFAIEQLALSTEYRIPARPTRVRQSFISDQTTYPRCRVVDAVRLLES